MKQLKGEIVQVLPDVLTPGAMYFIPTDNGRFTINISDDNGDVRPLSELNLQDATGDLSFTKQVVAKEDGSLGVVDKSVGSNPIINYIEQVNMKSTSMANIKLVSESEVPVDHRDPTVEGYEKIKRNLRLFYKVVVDKSVFNADDFKIKSLTVINPTSKVSVSESNIITTSYKHFSDPNEPNNTWVFLTVDVSSEHVSPNDKYMSLADSFLKTEFYFGGKSSYDFSQFDATDVGSAYFPLHHQPDLPMLF